MAIGSENALSEIGQVVHRFPLGGDNRLPTESFSSSEILHLKLDSKARKRWKLLSRSFLKTLKWPTPSPTTS